MSKLLRQLAIVPALLAVSCSSRTDEQELFIEKAKTIQSDPFDPIKRAEIVTKLGLEKVKSERSGFVLKGDKYQAETIVERWQHPCGLSVTASKTEAKNIEGLLDFLTASASKREEIPQSNLDQVPIDFSNLSIGFPRSEKCEHGAHVQLLALPGYPGFPIENKR